VVIVFEPFGTTFETQRNALQTSRIEDVASDVMMVRRR
jgi:hypothetical protein